MAKWRKIAGWVLSGLLGALFLASAAAKFARPAELTKQFAELGLKDKELLIGSGEAISAVLFLIPMTHPLGVLLLSSYMGGAILAHMSHGEAYVTQSIILILVWVAGFLRRPWLFLDPPAGTPAPPPAS